MPAGRPPKYESAEQLQEAIDAYFANDQCDYTITGLVLSLGFCNRATFYDLEKMPEFSNTIKTARTRIENSYERELRNKAFAGAIFALKNFGWTDKQTIEHEGGISLKPVIINVEGE